MAASQTRRGGDEESTLQRNALYEVLLRVPAKPLCRFRSVCRSWRSLLSGPSSFAAAHAARHRDQPPLVAVCGLVPGSNYKAAEIKLLDTSSGHVVKRFDAGASSLLRRVWPDHGLVLIVRRDVDDRRRRRPALSVLDPATAAVSLLPGSYNNDDARITRSSFVFGRAAASSTGGGGEYKVLSLNTCPYYYNYRQFCKILTVDGSKRWRDAAAPPVTIKTFHRETVVASGVVYHLVDDSSDDASWTIAAFDLDEEQWLPDLLHGPAVEPLPPASTDSIGHRRLAEVNSRLAAVYSTDSTMEVWLLMSSADDKQAQWCKRCTVDLTSSSMKWHYRLLADPVPLWVLDDGRVAFWMRSGISQSASLWMYDPRTETSTRLANCLRLGASVYTGNLLQQQAQYAQRMEKP